MKLLRMIKQIIGDIKAFEKQIATIKKMHDRIENTKKLDDMLDRVCVASNNAGLKISDLPSFYKHMSELGYTLKETKTMGILSDMNLSNSENKRLAEIIDSLKLLCVEDKNDIEVLVYKALRDSSMSIENIYEVVQYYSKGKIVKLSEILPKFMDMCDKGIEAYESSRILAKELKTKTMKRKKLIKKKKEAIADIDRQIIDNMGDVLKALAIKKTKDNPLAGVGTILGLALKAKALSDQRHMIASQPIPPKFKKGGYTSSCTEPNKELMLNDLMNEYKHPHNRTNIFLL